MTISMGTHFSIPMGGRLDRRETGELSCHAAHEGETSKLQKRSHDIDENKGSAPKDEAKSDVH